MELKRRFIVLILLGLLIGALFPTLPAAARNPAIVTIILGQLQAVQPNQGSIELSTASWGLIRDLPGLVSALTVTPSITTESKKVIATDGLKQDLAGSSMSVSGDTLVVGAPQEVCYSGSACLPGAVYVFYRNQNGTWTEVQKITPFDGTADDRFGDAVAINGDTLVVGAPSADVGGWSGQGATYIYYRNQGGADEWGLVTKLVETGSEFNELFGQSVAISGDTLVVGAPDGDVAGIGTAYVYYRNQSGTNAWGLVKKVIPTPLPLEGDHFGFAVSISGDTIAITARSKAAYVFYRNQNGANTWGQVKKLTISDNTERGIGRSISISGDTLAVGGWGVQCNTGYGTGNTGSAYVFYRNQGGADQWGQVRKLTAADSQCGFFGGSVSVSGDTLVVGDADAPIGSNDRQGAAYLFCRNEGGANAWGQVQKLIASDGVASDNLGYSVSINGGTAMVGAPLVTINGMELYGAVYVYDLDTDSDALPDRWETNGYDHNSDGIPDVDLPAMGANPFRKDIFVEVDYMGPTFNHLSHKPTERAMARVISAFAKAPVSNPDGSTGITLHIDYGPETVMNPVTRATWGSLSRSNELPHQVMIQPLGTAWNWSGFDNIKRFEPVRATIFHYAIFAHELGGNHKLGRGGISRNDINNDTAFRQGANNFVVSLGKWSSGIGTDQDQAGTFMHELGHNLGLRHGGVDHQNYKPNYLSVMNYSFVGGLIKDATTGHLDYSRFATIPLLNENNLDEQVGLNGGAALNDYGTRYSCRRPDTTSGWWSKIPLSQCLQPTSSSVWCNIMVVKANSPIDWDCSKGDPSTTQANINDSSWNEPDPSFTSFIGSDDWSALIYDGGSIGPAPSTTSLSQITNQVVTMDEFTFEEISKLYVPYKLALTRGVDQFGVSPGLSTNIPVTVTNIGALTATVLVGTDDAGSIGWFELSALPAPFTLAPGASQVFPIPLTVSASAADGDSDRVTVFADPQESPLMGDSAQLIAISHESQTKIYLPTLLKGH